MLLTPQLNSISRLEMCLPYPSFCRLILAYNRVLVAAYNALVSTYKSSLKTYMCLKVGHKESLEFRLQL